MSNCIKYGYDDDREHMIEIVLSVANGALTMVVVDDGKPSTRSKRRRRMCRSRSRTALSAALAFTWCGRLPTT